MTDGASAWAEKQEQEEERNRKIAAAEEALKEQVWIDKISLEIGAIKPGTEEYHKLLYLYRKADTIYKQRKLIDLLQ